MNKVMLGLTILITISLSGCEEYSKRLASYDGYENVRDVGRGYIMYEIEHGTITCREHTSRSELTCWKN